MWLCSLAFASAGLFFGCTLLGAQASNSHSQERQPLVKAQTNAVVVDVVVTSPNGKPVLGLSKQDFDLTEDGKPQAIDFFEEHSVTSAPVATLPKLPPHVFSNQPWGLQSDSVTVLLLDSLNTSEENQAYVHKQAVAFLNNLHLNETIAIFTLNSKLHLLEGFTPNASLLIAAMNSKAATPGTTIDSRTRDDDLRDKEEVSMTMHADHPEAAEADARSLAEHAGKQAGARSSLTFTALQQLARSLAAIPGRKNLFWFASTFPLSVFPDGSKRQTLSNGSEIPDELRETVNLLAQARVAIYPMSAQGILVDQTMNADSGGQPQGDSFETNPFQQTSANAANTASMEQLASDTGGEASNSSNDLTKAMVQASQNASHYYTLVYTPNNTRMDGKFRRIDVKPIQGKYKLAYRRGYYADNGTTTQSAQSTDPLARFLVPGVPSSTQITYRVSAAPSASQPEPNGVRAGGNAKLADPLVRYRIDFAIPAKDVNLQAGPNGTHVGKIEVALVAYDHEGKKLNWTAESMAESLDAASYASAEQSGLPAHLEIDLPKIDAFVTTGVYDWDSQEIGTLEIPVSYAAATFAVPPPARECCSAAVPAEAPTAATESGPQPGPESTKASPDDPVLMLRPPHHTASNTVIQEGHIHLDVVVSDSAGKPVTGLDPWDFKLLDNGSPRKILSFRYYDGVAVKPDPPVEVILLVDTVNLPFEQIAFVRQELEHFLRKNGGHLAQPVSLFLLTDTGLQVQPRPSVDGNALLEVVHQINGNISTINSAMGSGGYLERVQLSVRQLAAIAENEARKPGRKLVIWLGPGWPMLDRPADGFSEKDQRRYFDTIVELSKQLREARITLYSVAPLDSSVGSGKFNLLYQDFLKGVRSAREATTGNLALKVLVTQTGGEIMGPGNDLAEQIDRCIADANAFYTISFNPPVAAHADEYHSIQLLNQAGLGVRTNTSYYNEPPGN
jgi:VWFA-related protein